MTNMAEPKGMVSLTQQPLGWPTYKYQHCLKTVMPSKCESLLCPSHNNSLLPYCILFCLSAIFVMLVLVLLKSRYNPPYYYSLPYILPYYTVYLTTVYLLQVYFERLLHFLAIGANMRLHRNVPKELLPTSAYNKQPERWRVRELPPVTTSQGQWRSVQERDQSRHSMTEDKAGPGRDQREMHTQSRSSNARSAHYADVRPPSAYSESIVLKPSPRTSDWSRNHKLDSAKVSYIYFLHFMFTKCVLILIFFKLCKLCIISNIFRSNSASLDMIFELLIISTLTLR